MSVQVIPYLHVKGAARAIEFYVQAFGANGSGSDSASQTGGSATPIPDRRRADHARRRVPGVRIRVRPIRSVRYFSGDPSHGTRTSDAVAERAVAAGAKLPKPIRDEFYGERAGKLEESRSGTSGHVVTHIEDVVA